MMGVWDGWDGWDSAAGPIRPIRPIRPILPSSSCCRFPGHLRHPLLQVCRIHRLREIEALHVVAAELLQAVVDRLALHSLGDDAAAEVLCELNRGVDDGFIGGR